MSWGKTSGGDPFSSIRNPYTHLSAIFLNRNANPAFHFDGLNGVVN